MIKKLLVLLLSTLLTGSALAHSMSVENPTILLTEKNTATLRGPVDGKNVRNVQKKLHSLVKERGFQNYPLYLILDTPGGSIIDGENLIQYAKKIRNLHTITIFAASMGSAIVQALPGNRYITENGVQMFHRASLSLHGQIEDGEVEARLNFFKNMVRYMEFRSAQRMSISIQDYKQRVKDEWWMNAVQAWLQKAADRIVDLECSEELVEQKERLEIQVFIFRIKLDFSGCPLFRMPEVADEKSKAALNAHRDEVRKKFSQGIF